MRGLVAASAALVGIYIFVPNGVQAAPGDFKAPAIGTEFDWNINGQPSSVKIVGVSGRVLTVAAPGSLFHFYGGYLRMEGFSGEDLRLNTSKLDALWPLRVGESASLEAQYGTYANEIEIKVVGQKKVTVPAGTFDAIVLEKDERSLNSYGYRSVTRDWLVPAIGYTVKYTYNETGGPHAGRAFEGEVTAIHVPK